ncbi:hypothetical protein B0F88_1122 [Methylobacter tundripaludum]|uniref:Uncharacterized protein n=1 Tax=Methylobacter tundripaludum TaxID=173365 RepID=A0A2S6GSR9_9GAMM|nr:hypothetical protein B0F88_1122 [Methylobacter tundripaludum]
MYEILGNDKNCPTYRTTDCTLPRFMSSTQSFLFCQVKVNPFVLSLSKDERIYAELNDFYSTDQY